MAEATTMEMLTELTTEAAVDMDFNFVGLWITMGVLGGFVLCVVLYGIFVTMCGKLDLPPMAEDKQPLAKDVGHEEEAKRSEKQPTPDNDAQVESAVVAMPTTDNDAETETSASKGTTPNTEPSATVDIASSREDLVDGGAGSAAKSENVAIEVHERDVDTTDEMN